MCCSVFVFFWFLFNDPATTEIYPLSLHDALPISIRKFSRSSSREAAKRLPTLARLGCQRDRGRETGLSESGRVRFGRGFPQYSSCPSDCDSPPEPSQTSISSNSVPVPAVMSGTIDITCGQGL